jgi:hypothetical protein
MSVKDEEFATFRKEIYLELLAIQARLNALESWRDDYETYRMEQNERR